MIYYPGENYPNSHHLNVVKFSKSNPDKLPGLAVGLGSPIKGGPQNRNDGADNLSQELPNDPRIRYVRLRRRRSIGAKRNLGCQLARGSVIACWDDDDWYAPDRLGAQMAPLLSGKAEMSALPVRVFFDLNKWEFWTCSPELHRRLWFANVAGGTLVFRRHVWERLAQYPDQSLAEDGFFLREALRRGAKLARIDRERLFIYLRHGKNSWSFTCGQHGNSQGWKRIPEPGLPPDDRAFYQKMTSKFGHFEPAVLKKTH
jgi:glycosyltransferase involved in cell wall biosynthesis